MSPAASHRGLVGLDDVGLRDQQESWRYSGAMRSATRWKRSQRVLRTHRDTLALVDIFEPGWPASRPERADHREEDRAEESHEVQAEEKGGGDPEQPPEQHLLL